MSIRNFIFFLLFLVMIGSCLWAYSAENFFVSFESLKSSRWFITITIDLYINLVLIGILGFYFDPKPKRAIIVCALSFAGGALVSVPHCAMLVHWNKKETNI